MRNLKFGEKGGKIILDSNLTEEEVDLDFVGYPYIEIKSDGEYEILTSKYSPAGLISTYSGSGDNAFTWDYASPVACRYLMIKLTSGTYLEATISMHAGNGNGN